LADPVRRLLIAAVVLLGLLVALDRIAVHAAESLVAKRVQSQEHLDHKPDVSIGGFPFLTQAVGGKYDDVTVAFYDLHRGPVAVHVFTAHLVGVHVPLHAVISGKVHSVPVDSLTGTVSVTFAELNRYLAPKHLHVSAAGSDAVHVTGPLGVSGTGHLVTTAEGVAVTVGGGLDFTIPLPGLPFGVRFVHAAVSGDAIAVSATAEHVVLRSAP
jgi:hypothetical protein